MTSSNCAICGVSDEVTELSMTIVDFKNGVKVTTTYSISLCRKHRSLFRLKLGVFLKGDEDAPHPV